MYTQFDDQFSLHRVKLSAGVLSLSRKQGLQGEMEALLGDASSCKIPLEVVHVNKGGHGSLPVSKIGKTSVRYVGATPAISAERDTNGNPVMIFMGEGVVVVTYNSEKIRAAGRNRGAHGKRKIYIIVP